MRAPRGSPREEGPQLREDSRKGKRLAFSPHWNDGHYFERREEKIEPELRGTPFLREVASDKHLARTKPPRTEGDGSRIFRKSSPLSVKMRHNDWSPHCGYGRYFDAVEEKLDCGIRGAGQLHGTDALTLKKPLDIRTTSPRSPRKANAGHTGASDAPLPQFGGRSKSQPSGRKGFFKRVSCRNDGYFQGHIRQEGFGDCAHHVGHCKLREDMPNDRITYMR
eukprot:TRINITY_DN12681_c0_g1_i2.p1 TRINITY_DN12681_c0_g1~~TRINITY_DN12681_c0_g1_i2.p1  ORF type:complete len:256 (+),score=38.15 TRINITY_DN12681_c0_g1_i2:105-770(+)